MKENKIAKMIVDTAYQINFGVSLIKDGIF